MYRVSLLILTFLVFQACRPAAAPVAVGNKPISVNGVPAKDADAQPLKPVGEMSWTGFEGNVQKVKDLNGKVVILDFWATYCKPCLEEIPHLVELQNKYADLKVVGLHVGGEEDVPKVPAFVERLKINYVLAYPDNELSNVLLGNDNSIPQTIIFDRRGNPVKRFVGFDEIIQAELDEAIEQAMKQ